MGGLVGLLGQAAGHDLAVDDQGFSRVGEKRLGSGVEMGGQAAIQGVQGLAQRRAPALVVAGMAAGGAAAIRSPAFHAVGAAPGRGLADAHVLPWRVFFEHRGEIGQGQAVAAVTRLVQHVGQGHSPKVKWWP
jgi:hypothetical protein